jgi:predicted MFS family arabinose efflux permease
MSAAAAQPDAGRTAGVNANAVLAIVAVAQFMVILDASIVNDALPTIRRDVGFSKQSLSWILNAYTLIFGGFLLLGGRAADRLGRRRLFMAGIALFSGASLVSESPSPRASCSSPAGTGAGRGRWCRRLRSRSS